jgi:HPt (histidine-containing phosphotransfer) domain-containing protein
MLDSGEILRSEALPGADVADLCTAAIDHTHLRRFTMGDLQLEREVLSLFADELPRTLATLQGAKTDLEWKIAAHTLKGSARTVGAWRLAAAAVAAERFPSLAAESTDRKEAVAACEQAVRDAVVYIAGLAAQK